MDSVTIMGSRKKLDIRGGYAFFWHQWPSNWESSPMLIENTLYNCVEQWMMAEKAKLFGDEETLRKIMESPHPKVHRELGRKVRDYSEEKWDRVRSSVVLRGTLEKYRQNPVLKDLLLATNNVIFVETNPYDKIWGIGMDGSNPDILDSSKWLGQNLLGRIVTEARDTIRREENLRDHE